MKSTADDPYNIVDHSVEFDETQFSGPLVPVERLQRLLLGLACFLMSWHILRPGELNFTLSDFFFLSCFVILLVRQRVNMMPMQSMTGYWYLALSMMLGGLLIGSIFNGDPLRWTNIASQYLFALALVPMTLMSQERDWIRRCLLYFVLGVAASELVTLGFANLMSYSQTSALLGPNVVAGNGRIGGFVSDPNLNGAIIAFSIVALFHAHHHRTIHALFALIVGAVLVWALLATASFTAFAATGIAIAIYFFCSSIGQFLKFGIPLILAGATYIAFDLPLPEAFSERVVGAVTTGDLSQAGTFTHRSALIAEAWEMSKDTLFIGLGIDRFRIESIYGMPVHQFWMLLLTEGGLLSFAGLLVIFSILGIMGLKATTLHRQDGALILAFLAILLIFSTSIPHMYNRLWFGPLMLALAATYTRLRSPFYQEPDDEPPFEAGGFSTNGGPR